MPYPISFNFTLPPPPNGFQGNLGQVFALIQQTLQGSLAQDAAVLGQGTVLPSSNVGPFIYTGVDPPQLYTWSTSQGKYVVSSLPANTPYVSIIALGNYFGGYNALGTQINVNYSQLIGLPAGLLGGVVTAGYVGTTAQMNALAANPYQTFFNTDINANCRYYNNSWHTDSGVPGDIKFVQAGTLALALTNNPGWLQCSAATDRVLIAAGNLYGQNTQGGNASVTLNQTQLPASLNGLTITSQNSVSGAGTLGIAAPGNNTTPTTVNVSIANSGGGQPTPILPPYLAEWCLQKQ